MRDLTDIWTATDVTGDLNPNSDAFKSGRSHSLIWVILGGALTIGSIIIISIITKRAIAKATKEYQQLSTIDGDVEAGYTRIELRSFNHQ
jgi:hypothetical protein